MFTNQYSIARKQAFFDRLAPRWKAGSYLDDEEVKAVRRCLTRLRILPGDLVLDLGGGTGRLANFLVKMFSLRCLVVDVSSGMLNKGRFRLSHPLIAWLQADGHHLPLGRESLNHIFCFSTFPHFDCPERVLKECRRVLKPGGNFLIIHSRNRAAINYFHSCQSPVIASDRLPSRQCFDAWAAGLHWKKRWLEDGENGFTVHYRKPE